MHNDPQILRVYQNLDKYLKPQKALIIFGPRQIGKTTLLNTFLNSCNLRYKFVSGDNLSVQQALSVPDIETLRGYVEKIELLVIDEAQKIPNIGQSLKILIDQVPNLKIIATGSSSFELAGQIGEPLTGRKITLTMYPISQMELLNLHNRYELKEKLSEWLVFGAYPEVITTPSIVDKKSLLEEITHSYLLKDILELDRVKNSKALLDLLRLLAYQIGKEVSLSELASNLGIDYKTVARYLDLFEKSFVIYNLRGFSKNLRKEITKKSKYYFYDLGVRNTIISNFNQLEQRNDIGELWENFLFIERIKKRSYQNIFANMYFWRTWDQKEIDLIEERDGNLFAYEFKWHDTNKSCKAPLDWSNNYTESIFTEINRQNYLEFIT